MFFRPKHVYLDHAAATPPDRGLAQGALSASLHNFANPGGLYASAIDSNNLLESARSMAAKSLHALPSEITFTRGGTESCNMAVFGIIKSLFIPTKTPVRVLVNPMEHPAVLESLLHCASMGIAVLQELPITETGIIDLVEAKKMMYEFKPDVVICQYVNSEIGTIQPIAELGKMILTYRKSAQTRAPYFICDAIQAFNYIDCNVLQLHTDCLIISGSKIYGPRSGALLYIKSGTPMEPVLYGGGQEHSLRPGTQDPSVAMWLANAMHSATVDRNSESQRLQNIQKHTFDIIAQLLPDAIINGSTENRIPNNINISIPDCDSEYLVLAMDAAGFAVSSQSACSAKSGARSRIISRLATARGDAPGNYADLRITMGRTTTKGDMDRCVQALVKIIRKYKSWK